MRNMLYTAKFHSTKSPFNYKHFYHRMNDRCIEPYYTDFNRNNAGAISCNIAKLVSNYKICMYIFISD